MVPVADLGINHRNELIVATHGRGIYKIDLSPLYYFYNDGIADVDTPFVFPVLNFPAVKRRVSHRDVDLASVKKQNFNFYLPSTDTVRISIFNDSDDLLFAEDIEGKAGLNVYRWNQVLDKQESLEPYFVEYEKYIEPGSYQLQLEFHDKKIDRIFRVK